MEKWKRELIRYLFHYSARRLNEEAAFTVKHPYVPPALHKYRRFSDQHKGALTNGVLWRCSPDKFTDPYDSIVYFDQTRFWVEDQSAEDFIASMEEMTRTLGSGAKWLPKPIQNPVQQRDWRRRVNASLLKHRPAHERQAMLDAIDRWFDIQGEQAVRFVSKRARAGLSVLSLCENATSVLMWSHYSDGHKGFCIEYDLSTLRGDDLRRRQCFPVFYRRKLTDATRYLARQDFHNYNNLFGIYMCLLKSDEWAYEREWRLVLPTGPSHANSAVKMPKPVAIILGALAQPDDEAWMRTFCHRNGIPLKRAVQRHNEFRLEIRNA
jgi:hypothetical protein